MYSPNIKYWTFEVEKYGLVFVYALIQIRFCLWIFFRLIYRNSIYDILKKKWHRCKKIVRKTLTQKKIWIFKCFKIDLIFKNPYHIHLLMDFNFFLFNMHVKKLGSWASIHIIFIISSTTFNPPFTQWHHM
jgi:hypothetical protein